jgi:acetoin utilization deacetylase AcuC-like enzyme
MNVGLVYDPIYLKHDTGAHVETADRLAAVNSLLEFSHIKDRLTPLKPRPATLEEIGRVHSQEHITNVERMTSNGGGWLDADTVISSASYEVALLAAGGAITAVDAVLEETIDNAFAAVRPPGHHASRRSAMGFCLFNNVAIAAQHLLANSQCHRILIADFDVHHGNSTQDFFYDDPRVLYFSVHQSPLYPGTGQINETGSGEGKGTIINIPLPPWSGDEEYLRAFREVLIPAAHRFQPEFILVSAGYDAHWADGIAMHRVTVSGFAEMVGILKNLADKHCAGRVAFVLEGGYHIEALATSVRATIEVLLGSTDISDPLGNPSVLRQPASIDSLIRRAKHTHKLE